jgi:cytidylate kinase
VPVTIVSGSPGCGKTSVCRILAATQTLGVHIESDYFFGFLPNKLDPSMPGSQSQNETVLRAYTVASEIYSSGGYSVYLDGVIGPWLLPLITPVLHRFDYVLLHASESVALARVRQRTTQGSARPSVAMRMHRQFSAVIDSYGAHVVRTDHKSAEEVAREIDTYRGTGKFTVSDA